MNWHKLSTILRKYYCNKGLEEWFANDEEYLSRAFISIERLWLMQFREIEKIKHIMLSEAPLWGKSEKYIYNPVSKNSQYFYRSDLEHIINIHINDKADFIKELNRIGFIILDISPYALNAENTKINYRDLSTRDYRSLLIDTIPVYFSEKLELINKKRHISVNVFYRYGRVRNAFNDLIGEAVLKNGLVNSEDMILDISKNGGGIDKNKLKAIILNNR